MSDNFEKLKKKYFSTFAKKKELIDAAWQTGDIKTLEGLLHKLTGSSGCYGFNNLHQMCLKTLANIDESFNIVNKHSLEQNLKELYSLLDSKNIEN
jgi:HPt (histidine-containing phosphotransfer) domain-containing protein